MAYSAFLAEHDKLKNQYVQVTPKNLSSRGLDAGAEERSEEAPDHENYNGALRSTLAKDC